MTTNAELRINLAALKRQDPYISNIKDSSTHVAVYSFSPQSNGWEKTDVEGTLFVYRRVAPPYWGFTIMNRLSMENLTEPLNNELEFQTQNPFLLYRNAKLLIYGIWFYDHDDCKRIGSLLEKLSKDTSKPGHTNSVNLQRINPFELMAKSSSPTSNSIASVSPGSSVGGAPRPPSNNEEADSESDDKEVVVNSKGVDIMDLLCKAQNRYEKEKRNTPDPVTENAASEPVISPIDTDVPLVKPVPVKPSHPQKLDVASLFKQQSSKPPDIPAGRNSSAESQTHATQQPQLPTPTMPTPYAGMGIVQHTVNLPAPSSNVTIPNHQTRARMVRSFSMNEMALRQQAGMNLDKYMNGGVMSVEEVEASLNKNAADTRQQELNSKLDKLIDHINLTGGLPGSGSAQPAQLPGKEGVPHYPGGKTSGNSGSMVVNGNSLYAGDDVFSTPETIHPYSSKLPTFPTQNQIRFPTGVPGTLPVKSRSMSTSVVHPGHMVVHPPSATAHTMAFPIVPNQHVATSVMFPSLSRNNLPPKQNEQNATLHGNAVVRKQSPINVPGQNLVSAITTAASTVRLTDKAKVQAPSAAKMSSKTSSPAVPATLISPEDFELSASTPQKKLELKQRLLRETPPVAQNSVIPKVSNVTAMPLTKDQLQHTLISLLKDSSFLAVVHKAYLTNFKQS